MEKDIYKVLRGYSDLSLSERKKLRELIEKFEKGDYINLKEIREKRFSLGPLDTDSCPCCGK